MPVDGSIDYIRAQRMMVLAKLSKVHGLRSSLQMLHSLSSLFSSLPSVCLLCCFPALHFSSSLKLKLTSKSMVSKSVAFKLSGPIWAVDKWVSLSVPFLPNLTSSPEYYVKRNDPRCKTGPNAALLLERYALIQPALSDEVDQWRGGRKRNEDESLLSNLGNTKRKSWRCR